MNKKILYIGNKLSQHGNTETSIETLGAFLEDEGYEMYYASSYKNKILRIVDMIFKTIKYSRKVDYVFIDVYSTQNFWYALLISQLCRLLKKKYISKLHGGNLPNRINKIFLLSKLIFKNSYKNVAPSAYLYKVFEKANFNNLVYIPNTFNIEKYFFKERTDLFPKLLWVRSFSSIYNPKMAIRVYSEVLKEFPKSQLCMVGPDKENMMEECKLYAKELGVSVLFTGKLSKEEWIALSKEYTVFINTTHFDNTPISVVEAMALGLPVVSTNVGGIPFLLKSEENALLVEDDNSEQMVQAIKTIFLNEKLKKNMIVNARKMVETFDWDIVKDKWFELLK